MGATFAPLHEYPEEAMTIPGIQPKPHRLPGCMKPTLTPSPGATEKGLTLLECLMAVAVMALTISLVMPPLLIAAATRVQTRRAEQALQLAQGEVDRIRNLVALNRHIVDLLPDVGNNTKIEDVSAPSKASSQIKTAAATCPTGVTITRYTGTQVPGDTALLVDVDADCRPDFLMQVFRANAEFAPTQLNNVSSAGQRRPSEFDLGVRVYSIVAGRTDSTNAAPGSTLSGLNAKPAPLGLTSGQKNQFNSPLAVLYTSISWSDRDGTLCSYQQGNTEGTIESCQTF